LCFHVNTLYRGCELALHNAVNTHFCTHRPLSQVSDTTVEKCRCAQLHCNVANCIVVKVGLREALELLKV
jgi:hypothetical protein